MAMRSTGTSRARQADTRRRRRRLSTRGGRRSPSVSGDRQLPSRAMKTILHPSDFSAASQSAFKKAIELAKTDRAMLELLHVISPVYPVGFRVRLSVYNRLAAAETTAASMRLVELVARARAAGAKARVTILEGRPADRIVHAARVKGADLIVMGTRGRTGLSRFMLGSVASRVVSMSPCPVLTVRDKK